MDQPQLCKRISLRKTITKAIIINTVVVVVVLSVKTYFYYDLYKEAQNSIMTHETIIFILAAVLILAIQPVYASDAVITVEYLDDGSRYVTIIEDVPTDTIQTFSTTTKTKSKTAYYESSSGEQLWYVRVTGTFTYGSGTAKCTASTPSAQAIGSTGKVSNISGSKSGNAASATATGKQY